MVNVTLNSKTTIPTIRRALPADTDGTSNYTTTPNSNTSWHYVGDNGLEIQDGETAYLSYNFRNATSNSSYSSAVQWIDTNNSNAVVTWSNGSSSYETTHSSSTQNRYIEHTNNTGSTQILRMQVRSINTQYITYAYNFGGFAWIASDKAKWEIVSPSSTVHRHRKFAIDKIYTVVPYSNSSIKIDGINNTCGEGIKEITVGTISTRIDFEGTGTCWFQITGKGFSVSE
jgi:hypothetical protein